MTMSGKSMCFQWEYAGRFDWLLTLFKDMAFTFMSYAKNGRGIDGLGWILHGDPYNCKAN